MMNVTKQLGVTYIDNMLINTIILKSSYKKVYKLYF